jgi:hypothetical protein
MIPVWPLTLDRQMGHDFKLMGWMGAPGDRRTHPTHEALARILSRSTQVNGRTFNPFAKPESAARGQNGQSRRLTCEIDLLLAMD